jgi:uncharacterized protein (TIGR00251 family)
MNVMYTLFNWQDTPPSTLTVRVTPKASANRIKTEQSSDGTTLVRVYVTAPPEDGKANKAVLELLAKQLGVAKSSLTILHGLHDRTKVIGISTL